MVRKKYKHSKNKKLKIIIIFIVIVVLLFLFSIISKKHEQKEKEEYVKNLNLEEIQTVEDLVIKLGDKYIKEIESKEENFQKDIYIEFKNSIDDTMKNNSSYIEKLMKQIARILQYDNFRIIDEKQEKFFSVICNKENNVLQEIYINGTEYNKYITLLKEEKYKEENKIELEVNSEILKKLISDSWSTEKLQLGKNYVEEGKYITYEDKGITIKKIVKNAYSIVFSENYTENIVNGINLDTPLEQIRDRLGEPAIENDYFIGYVCDEFYIFFNEIDIAVYKNPEKEMIEKSEQFSKLVKDFLDSMDAKAFINELTYLYEDYDIYSYNENYVSLIYYTRGIKVRFNVGAFNGLTIYKNFKGNILDGVSIEDIANGKNIDSNYVNVEITANSLEEFEIDRIKSLMEPEHEMEEEL